MKRSHKIGCGVFAAAVVLVAVVLLLREVVTERIHRIHHFRPANGVEVEVFHGSFADPTFNFYWRIHRQRAEVLPRQTFFMTHATPTQRFDIVTSADKTIVALAGADSTKLYAIRDLNTGTTWTSADLDSGEALLARVNQGQVKKYTLASSFQWRREQTQSNQASEAIGAEAAPQPQR